MAGGEGVLERREPSVLQRLDRADSSMRDAGDVVERQIGDESQEDDGALILGEGVDRGLQGWVDRVELVVEDGLIGQARVGGRWSRGATSPGVDEPVMGDREDPTPPRLGVTADAVHIPGDVEEHLAQQVLGVWCSLRSEITEQGGGELSVQRCRDILLDNTATRTGGDDRLHRGEQVGRDLNHRLRFRQVSAIGHRVRRVGVRRGRCRVGRRVVRVGVR
jgi:hypothetical protein